MNDIDSRLRSQADQIPRRPLAKDFTNIVMERSLAGSVRSRFTIWASNLKGAIVMKLHVKHAGLVVGASTALLLGGTTYAAVHWFGFDDGATYGNVITLENGDTRFWVSAMGGHCGDNKGRTFYEIKKDSKVTPAQISDMVAGACEYTDLSALFPGVALSGTVPTGMSLKSNTPGNYEKIIASTEVQTQHYVTVGTVKANQGTTMTVMFSHDNGYATETFPVDANAQVFDDGQTVSLSSLKAGDPVQLVMTVQATYGAIANLSLKWQDAGHDTLPGSSIYGIVRAHHAVYDVYAEGREFTRLVPNLKDIHGMSYEDASAFDQNPANLHEEYPL